MVVIRSTLVDGGGVTRDTMAVVMDSGDVHYFFPLPDGVHYSYTLRYRGRYDEAVASELERANAEVIRAW